MSARVSNRENCRVRARCSCILGLSRTYLLVGFALCLAGELLILALARGGGFKFSAQRRHTEEVPVARVVPQALWVTSGREIVKRADPEDAALVAVMGGFNLRGLQVRNV
jgi:hypothetical protein